MEAILNMFQYEKFTSDVPNSAVIVFPVDFSEKKNKLLPFMKKHFGQLANIIYQVKDADHIKDGFLVTQKSPDGGEVFGLFIDCLDKNDIYYNDLTEKLETFVDIFQSNGYIPNYMVYMTDPFVLEWTEKYLENFENRDDCTITFVSI